MDHGTSDEPISDSRLSFRLVLEGGRARLGEVPAVDVARLIDGAIRAVARAAELITGREPGQVGRRGTATENSTRFVLAAINPGSVAVELLGPNQGAPANETLDLDDPRLTEMAVSSTLDSLLGVEMDAYIASGLADLADMLGIGSRYDTIRFVVSGGSTGDRSGVLNRSARTRLRQLANEAPSSATTAIAGTLVEADFESRTARLRTPANRRVKVEFTDDYADEIQQALRQNAEFDGIVTYDPSTSQAVAVEMRSIRRTHQFGLDLTSTDYWQHHDVGALAAERGIQPIGDLSEIRDLLVDSEEVDRFFEALEL